MDRIYKIGIVILNYQTWEDTLSVVNELLKQEGVELFFSIVDNNSPNQSYEELSSKLQCNNDNLILTKNNSNDGYAKGNNLGLRMLEKVNCDFVIIMNNDVVFNDKYLLSKLSDTYVNLESPGFIAPRQFDIHKNLYKDIYNIPTFTDDLLRNLFLYRIISTLFKKSSLPQFGFPNKFEVELFNGSFLFIDYKLFRDLGFFDEETFLFGEERFWGTKIKNANRKCYIINNLSYIHAHSKTINKCVIPIQKFKYLNESIIKYTTKYRNNHRLKLFILKPFQIFSIFEINIINKIKGYFIKKNNL